MRSKTKIEFAIGEESLEGLNKLATLDEGKHFPVFPAQDGNGVTFGRTLDYGEYEGKGLPEWKNDRQLFVELNITFVVRVTCDREGTTYLEIAQDGHQSFYSFPFKGIDHRDSVFTAIDFEQRLSRFLISSGIYPLFWALYREKESDSMKRSEAYDKITANFESYFKNILKPKREREIETSEQDGLTLTAYERIKSGRNPKTDSEIEAEKLKFVERVFDAFRQIDSEGGKKTRLNVGSILFENEQGDPDIPSRMKRALNKFELLFRDMKNEYEDKKGAQNEI